MIDGNIYCWGDMNYIPKYPAYGLYNFVQITCALGHCCALDINGSFIHSF